VKTYDVIVIGSGSGLNVVGAALQNGLKVALVDKGPPGGTCLNVGCIPSKMLTASADRIMEVFESGKLGIHTEIGNIDFPAIMERMRKSISEDRKKVLQSLQSTENLDYYPVKARFVDDYTLEVQDERIKAPKIYIAAGSRNNIPAIKGLEENGYLTNETVLDLKVKPASLLIVGGGYVGVEYAHFFAAVGTRVVLVEYGERLLLNEEPEIAGLLLQKLSERIEIHLNTEVQKIEKVGGGLQISLKNRLNGFENQREVEKVMVAAGRRPNTDYLAPDKTGVEVDRRGYVRVDEYLETTRKNIYAFGDVIGKYMFTHVANREAQLAWHNSMHPEPRIMDYSVVPHAVFTYPQIAAVGLNEESALKQHRILVGKARYSDVAMGIARGESDGFAKVIVEEDTGKILGFHIIGPEASTLIQEVVDVMVAGGDLQLIQRSMHIHPALPEIIVRAFSELKEPSFPQIRSGRLKSLSY